MIVALEPKIYVIRRYRVQSNALIMQMQAFCHP
jgi:hypothetical protein